MTDALARQHIQRWTGQLVAPEYLGAHVSAPVAHQSGRTLPLDFRAATAFFGAFGVEWDLSTAIDDELSALAAWVDLHKRFRPLLHSGRLVRPESSDPAVLLHGVVSGDGDQALLAHVQIDESASNRGTVVRVPDLVADASYDTPVGRPRRPQGDQQVRGAVPRLARPRRSRSWGPCSAPAATGSRGGGPRP